MKSFPCVTWLQRGAASRKPGIKIIAPALMTCDEVDIPFNLATQVAELMTFLVEAQVSERAKSRVGSLVKNKIRTQVINSSIIHP